MNKVRPDTETIEHLDFKPECGYHHLKGLQPVAKCGQQAQWCAKLPCCGHAVLFCIGHATTVAIDLAFRCLGCGHRHVSRDGWAWVIV